MTDQARNRTAQNNAADQNRTPSQNGAPGQNAAPEQHATPAQDATGQDAAGRVSDLEARIAELEDRWLREVAELDNVRKRAAREAARQRSEERSRVAAEWLPVLDNLELALKHAQADPSAVIEGVQAVRDQALGVLTRLGFPRRDDLGAQFDPSRHEAVSAVADPDAPAGTVVQVIRPGYGDGDHQLRPAAVVVATRTE